MSTELFSPIFKIRVRPPEAAKMMGLSIKTLASMRVAGTGPSYQKIRGQIHYSIDRIQEWIQSHPEQVSTSQNPNIESINQGEGPCDE
jgi:hypothetical protein